MNPIPVPTGTRLCVTYSLHEASDPVSDRVVVLHHGICHTREQFVPLISQLNDLGIHAAVIDQQSENARFRNFIGAKQYREGMAAAAREIEKHRPIGGYVLHSMGALIGEEMQQTYPEFRRPTVFMAPIPVKGALPITLRILRRHPLSYLRSVLTLDIHSLARTPKQVRELFFDNRTPEPIVGQTTAQLKHAPFWIYCQLVLRPLVRPRIRNDDNPKLIISSETDEIFHPREYGNIKARYPQLEECRIPGGHDFFIEHAAASADFIARFHEPDKFHSIPRPHFEHQPGAMKLPERNQEADVPRSP